MSRFPRVLIFKVVPEGQVAKEPDGGLSSFNMKWNHHVLARRLNRGVKSSQYTVSCSASSCFPFTPLWTSHLTTAIFSCFIFVLETEISVPRFHAYSYLQHFFSNPKMKNKKKILIIMWQRSNYTSSICCFALSLLFQENSYSEREVNRTLNASKLNSSYFLLSLMMFSDIKLLPWKLVWQRYCTCCFQGSSKAPAFTSEVLEEGMTSQCLHGSNNRSLKTPSPVIRCLWDFTQIGHPLFPVPSLLSNQNKFKILFVEDPPGNARAEYGMKMDLPNQFFF